MHLAQKRGFLKEEGFDAELVIISGPVANVALSNGDTDYFSGFGSALRAILQGLPLRIVACYRPTPHFIRAGIKANRYMRANRDGTIPVLMSTYRIDKEVATAAYDSFIKGFNNDGSMPEDGFRRLLDDTKRLMKIDREVALSEVADLSILKEAQRELGIK